MISLESTPPAQPPAPPASLEHRRLRGGAFWQTIPRYAGVDEATFLDHVWQGRHSVKTPDELFETISGLVDEAFIADARLGFEHAPMAVRVSPYLIASIDWSRPYEDPIRRQFIPLLSTARPDHPRLTLDSLHEQEDSPVPGLIHRYADKALFLPLQTCPVYCRFCTRSYVIGPDTESVDKLALGTTPASWGPVFDYIAAHSEIEDIVISGGDAYQLSPKNLAFIGDSLLAIPHVRRMRFATKGLAVMPMKILTDPAWVDALVGVVDRGRALGKEVVVHTHFNHPNEISAITARAAAVLFERGVYVRNQTVLMRGVNDDAATMLLLVKRLEYINIHPLLRLHARLGQRRRGPAHVGANRAGHRERPCAERPPATTRPLSSATHPAAAASATCIRSSGTTATPASRSGRRPASNPGKYFLYFDPLNTLTPTMQTRWSVPELQDRMIADALAHAGGTVAALA